MGNIFVTEDGYYTKEDNTLENQPEVKATQESVADAAFKAAGVTVPQKTAKQLEKEKKREEAYWKGMISRAEARDLVVAVTSQYDERMRLMYVAVHSVISALKDKGLATEEEMTEYAKPFFSQMYGVTDPVAGGEPSENAQQDVPVADSTDSGSAPASESN